jgi:glycosyltransferase involved in cell wall biosynthesis
MPPEGNSVPDRPSFRVAFAHDCRRHDGMFVAMDQALEALKGSPAHVEVYTCLDPSLAREYPDLGHRVPGYRVPPGGDFERGINRLLPVFAHRLRGIQADLVHLWSVQLAAVTRDRSNVLITIPDLAKYSTRYYGRIASYLFNRMLPLARRAVGLTCYTEWTRRDIVRVLEVPPDRVTVVPPWAVAQPRPRPQEDAFRPPTVEDPWNLLAVAVDRPHKNLGFFLDVLAGLDARFRGVVVTRPRPETVARLRELGLASRVRFVSGIEDLSSLYDDADVLLHPSEYEGFGLPLLEAMARRVPVIASDRTCIPEVVGTGGTTLRLDSTQRWVEAVERLADPDVYRRSAEAAYRRAAVFHQEGTRDALLRAYGAAMARGPRSGIPG